MTAYKKVKSNPEVFVIQIPSRQHKMLMRKFYNRFHVGKNGIRLGNFQNFVFLQIFN